MARKSLTQILADAAVAFPDNTTELITPAILRAWIGDFVAAIRPAYGLISLVSAAQAVTTTPQPLVMNVSQLSPVIDYTLTPALSRAVRLEPGMTRITFNADVNGVNNQTVSFVLFKDGVDSGWRITVFMSAVTNTESVSLVAMVYSSSTATYELRVACTANATLTFSNVILLCETVSVWDYT